MSHEQAPRATEDEMHGAINKLRPLDPDRSSLDRFLDYVDIDVEGSDPSETGRNKAGKDKIGITRYGPPQLYGGPDMGMTYSKRTRTRPNGDKISLYSDYQEGSGDDVSLPRKRGRIARLLRMSEYAYPKTNLRAVRTVKLPDGSEEATYRDLSWDPAIVRGSIKTAAEKLEPAAQKAKAKKAA